MSREDPLLGRDCRAYVVQADLAARCRVALAAVQESLRGGLRGVFVCPPSTLHVSVAVLLSVRKDYSPSKDALWDRWGRLWCAELDGLVGGLAPFDLRFTRLGISEAAVVALADPVPAIDAIRQLAAQLQQRAGLVAHQPAIVHCTLLRYLRSGEDLSVLRRLAAEARPVCSSPVSELAMRRELVYPSLASQALAELPLARPCPHR